jgi:hypothetical protein
MTKFKLGLWVTLAVLLAALGGWIYGWSGTSALRSEVAAKRLRLQLLEARTQILDARVNVYTVNFGNASKNLEFAKPPLRAARELLEQQGQRELSAKLESALQQASEAQQLASKFNQDANSRAGDASRLIDEVLQATRPVGQ